MEAMTRCTVHGGREKLCALVGLIAAIVVDVNVKAEFHFDETLSVSENASWTTDEAAGLRWSSGADQAASKASGLATTTDLRKYTLWTTTQPFSNINQTLLLQYTVRYNRRINCAGAFVKLYQPSSKFDANSPHELLFGPDVCGQSKQVRVELTDSKGASKALKHHIQFPIDHLTHYYSLVLHTNNTFEVLVDNQLRHRGSLYDNFDLIPPALIEDPAAVKPGFWDEGPLIDDPKMVRPPGWEEWIPDPQAVKPVEWDDEEDGAWEPPKIRNPKGLWTPGRVENPAYMGPWKAPLIPNPEFVDDKELYVRNIGYIAFDFFQEESGTTFDEVLLCTDCLEHGRQRAAEGIRRRRPAELAELQAEREAASAQKVDECPLLRDALCTVGVNIVNPGTLHQQARLPGDKAATLAKERGWQQYFQYEPEDFSAPDDQETKEEDPSYEPPDYWYHVYHTDDFSNPDANTADEVVIQHDEL